MKRALYNQPDATPCGSTDNRKRNKTANLLHPFKNGAGKLLLTLCLLMTSITTWAQTYYVFQNGTHGYLYNDNGTLKSSTTFQGASSVWYSTTALGTTSQTIRSYSDNSRYLNVGANNGGTVSLGTSTTARWQLRTYLTTRSGTTNYYLKATNATSFSTASGNNGNRYTPIAVTISNTDPTLSAITISGGTSEMTATVNSPAFSASATYTPLRTNYYFNGADHYVNGASATVEYSWSLSGIEATYAEVTSAGVVRYKSPIPERERTASLTCTATAGGLTQTATTTIKFINPNALYNPSISYDNAAGGRVSVTLSYPESDPDVKLYYTTNGSTPSSSSTLYTGTFEVASNTTVKVIAVKGSTTSGVTSEVVTTISSGVSGGKVVLDDREDHTWTYYAGVPEEVDGGNYNTKYLGKLYSPNPRNVKITYNGVNGIANSNITVKVSTRTGEGQTSFVYYKTLEEGTTAGQYPYQVISNPFSVRPSTGTGTSKVFYGFNGWKIVSGGKYIRGYNDNQTLPLDAEIVFENLDQDVAYTPNCTSAEIVFETTWTQANVQRGGGNVSNAAFNGGNYEKNFCIINANSGALAPTYPVTIMGVEPDGSATYTNTIGGMVTPVAGVANTTKLEYVTWNPGANIDARGRNFTIGRGVTTSGTSRELYGTNQTPSATNIIDQVLKVESGTYSYFRHFTSSGTNRIRKQIVVFGCDYDRAKADNDKIKITGRMIGAEGSGAGDANGDHNPNLFMSKTYMKSGTFMSNVDLAGAGYQNSYYLGINAASNATGKRLFEMEGGDLQNSIAGGMDVDKTGTKDDEDYINVYIRIRGGHVKGCIYGAARYALSQGSRQIVITGGEVNSWIAGGANGDEQTEGATSGASYIYVGGNAIVGSKDGINSANSNTSIGSSIGGCVYGAGCGYGPNSSSGNMVLGTNVVVADNAYVERGVYGGGAFGYCATDKTANIYITGGHVEGKSGNYKDRAGTTTNGIIGGVFGGARMRYGGSANIYMTGGWVETGVYGGSNYTGTMEHDVKMVITGGKVGTDATHTGNVHGGGYGDGTVVSGNVELTLGNLADERGAKIYGNVYGGSALGTTGGTGKHTYVTVNRGSVTGNVFGGGMGETGSNTKGVVTGAIKVDVYGTDPKPTDGTYALYGVYGGGDLAPYSGTPLVTVHNCDNSIEYVYGGGNATSVAGTDVTIWGGNKIGNVFGGGNGQVTAANISGSTNVKIYGGTIENVFPGSNTNGTIGGNLNLTIEKHAGTDGCEGDGKCPFDLGNVYSGGNKAASKIGNVTIGCLGNGDKITNLFGGAKQANVTGDVNLLITGNHIENVFGGNDISGQPSGTITVVVDWDPTCTGAYLGNVYGGGRDASYEAPNGNKDYPQVFVRNAVVEHDVFGGGLGESALVTGNPQVTVSTQCPTQGHTNDHMVHIKGSLYGGGSAAPVTGNPVVNTRGLAGDAKKVQIDNYVFGGGFGQTAVVTGNTEVNIKGNTVVNKNVYGGGNGGLVTGNTNIVIGD